MALLDGRVNSAVQLQEFCSCRQKVSQHLGTHGPSSTTSNLMVQKHETEPHRLPECTFVYIFFFKKNLIHRKHIALVRKDTVMKEALARVSPASVKLSVCS